MEIVPVSLGDRSYDIAIGHGILDAVGQRLKGCGFSKTLALVSNPTVFNLYGERVLASVKAAGFKCSCVLLPDGEEYKDLNWANYILSELLKEGLDRKSALIALGGGVIGDITGFAASIYMRGIGYVQIPTTLLAQVDSSVGGKTGVNHALGKNMIGSFYQPRLVWIDIETLSTLPWRQRLSGLAEVIKYGVIWDADFFRYLVEKTDELLSFIPDNLIYIITRSCQIKAEVVSGDETESGLRAILNYGHTVGHAIETITGYRKFLHGEAVAIGMYAAACIAVEHSMLAPTDMVQLRNVLESYHLPFSVPDYIDHNQLVGLMYHDKKAVSGGLRFVLPDKIGSVRLVSVDDEGYILAGLQKTL
ncbi:MAG: 3-dehydroquinate synthase [Candidatus Magnetobacterium sp. LHC-1]|uniref:3-dehydroquinate synthase n=1 Tax=Candidatus Magnetobacterium casense TaxID=1455061 RepID=A0ABS6RYN6_9BACT|nr:3-dehydroquinate synthase [Candidatus Magnetobacterium casensis]MBF0607396.1 3-dehydroquinate synthase [Nitrospirota bacterium]MBV6341762.1 3-dehydroquinate synthase [Candidatus Magnetobacterium casensis]